MKKLLLLFFLCNTVFPAYFFDSFSGSMAAPWGIPFYYCKDGAVVPHTSSSAIAFSNSQLVFTGQPFTGDAAAKDGVWHGRNAWLTNKYHASARSPFGWEIIRTYSDLDADNGNANTPRLTYTVWNSLIMYVDSEPPLVKTTNVNNFSNQGDTFAWFFELRDWLKWYDKTTCQHLLSLYSTSSTPLNSDLLTARSPAGKIYNISNLILTGYNYAGNNSAANETNLGFRFTHNGSAVSLYINPDPDNVKPGYPDEWLFITAETVLWRSNIQLMVGHGNSWSGGQTTDLNLDNLLIRSAASSSGFNIYRKKHKIYLAIKVVLKPVRNAGVNFIRV
ncbi:MAG TPA: hypothetical protein VKS21_09435, partial [Spirochaetota bacterium]|nr:hypothetical protein [Spirochaetota bacterium]